MVREVMKYIAEDGSEHGTRQLAEAQDRFIALARMADKEDWAYELDTDKMVHWIASNAAAVRAFLDFIKPVGK